MTDLYFEGDQVGSRMTEFDRIKSLAMGTCFTVEEIDMAWSHIREIDDKSFDRFGLWVHQMAAFGPNSLVNLAKAMQNYTTGCIYRRPSI